MDLLYSYRGITFIWNPAKATENRLKHGVSFETACEPFFDQLAEFIEAGVEEESRLAIIGVTEDRKLLYVVHLELQQNMVRIISARPITEQERKRYANGE